MFIPSAQKKALLQSMIDGDYDAMEVHLLNAPVDFNEDTTGADIFAAKATFDGYAATTAQSFSDPVKGSGGNYEIIMDNQSFVCTGDTVTENIYGFALTTATHAAFLAGMLFDEPIAAGAPDQIISFVPRISVGDVDGSVVMTM